MTETRVLPHSEDAERSLLGAVITENRMLDMVVDRVVDQDFFRDAHQRIYRGILALHGRSAAVDYVTLKDELQRRGDLDEAGGPAYVASLDHGIPRSTNVTNYVDIVKRLSTLRHIITAAHRILDIAYEDAADASDVLNEAEATLLRMSERAMPGDLKDPATLVREFFPVLEAATDTRGVLRGLSTGFRDLDFYLRGMQPGNLIILGGRPGHGKSTLGLQLALHVAHSAPVAFFSVEMSQSEQMFRVTAVEGRLDGHSLQSGRLSESEQVKAMNALNRFAEGRFFHDETASLTALQIRSRARRMKARHGLALIVVDYLQLLTHAKADSREQAVAQTCRTLKLVARELNVPVLALSQLSRKADERSGERRPQLSDLRESGAIEQDADVVLLLYRPQGTSDGIVKQIPPVELMIAKQRNGPTASIELTWLAEQYRFAELEYAR